jgi:AcrR family transcriptional regulator
MRLSAPDRRKELLTAALDLFAKQGFRGTTTKEIARRAGISEALLFRHFPSKEVLYWSVLQEQCEVRRGRASLDALLQSESSDADLFAAIAEDLLTRNFADSRLYRLLLFSALEDHQLSHRFFTTYISQYYEAVATHIRGRIKEGRFRKTDPLLAARLFIGMALHYFLVEQLFKGTRQQDIDIKKISRTATEIWLEGMSPVTSALNGNGAHKSGRKPSKPVTVRTLEKAAHVSR